MGPMILLTFSLIMFGVLLIYIIYTDIKEKGLHSGIERNKGQPTFKRKSFKEAKKEIIKESKDDLIIMVITVIVFGGIFYVAKLMGWLNT